MPDQIQCRHCGKPGTPPTDITWGGELGEAIQSRVCADCWREWEAFSVKMVNEYRLSMSNPEHYKVYVDQLKQWVGLTQAESE